MSIFPEAKAAPFDFDARLPWQTCSTAPQTSGTAGSWSCRNGATVGPYSNAVRRNDMFESHAAAGFEASVVLPKKNNNNNKQKQN